jgi:hypothetical protein
MPDPRNHVTATTISSLFICGLHRHTVSTQQDKARSGWNFCYFLDISVTAVLVPDESKTTTRDMATMEAGIKRVLKSVLSLLVREIRFYNAKWIMLVVSFNK